MLWYLNEYIVNDKLRYKIVRSPQTYQNWELLNTYILYNNKFIFRGVFHKISMPPLL